MLDLTLHGQGMRARGAGGGQSQGKNEDRGSLSALFFANTKGNGAAAGWRVSVCVFDLSFFNDQRALSLLLSANPPLRASP
jgi:hypothetical protein